MANKKNERKNTENDSSRKPLFTGDYIHDMSVSEAEKAAEASNAIFNAIVHRGDYYEKNEKQ